MSQSNESVDVLIIGADLAGIGSACQLRQNYRDQSFAVLESRAVSGGTWDLFRYLGNSSWALKTDLIANYICKSLDKMQKGRHSHVIPSVKGNLSEVPLLDFDAGYVLRGRDIMPKNGNRLLWCNHDDYIKDFSSLKFTRNKYDELEFY